MSIIPTEANRVDELSSLLCSGFSLGSRSESYTPEMLRWRYFRARQAAEGNRSFVAEESGRFVAHIGLATTAFVSPGDARFCVSAVHPVDWLSTQTGGMLGTMLMFKALSQGSIQYSTGSTAGGNRILRSCGFEEVGPIPNWFYFFNPMKPAVLRFIHLKQRFPKNIVMFAVDMLRSALHAKHDADTSEIELERVSAFSNEVTRVFFDAPADWICTSREPSLLNYFLNVPNGSVSGWMIRARGRSIGFALTSVAEVNGVRMGNIVDCVLSTHNVPQWRAALERLKQKLRGDGCDIARCMGMLASLQVALREAGFFRRGSNKLFLRDPKKLLPRNRPFHITYLDGDLVI